MSDESAANNSTDSIATPAQLMAPPEPLPGTTRSGVAEDGVQGAGPGLGAATMTRELDADSSGRQEFLWRTHEYLGEYARFADSKAAFAGTIAGAVLAALYGAKAHAPLLASAPNTWSVSSWLALVGALVLVACVGLAAWIVAPRLGSSQSTGFIFWRGIAAYQTSEKLKVAFSATSSADLAEHLLGHVFDIATHVCVPKYRLVRWCILCLCVGALLSGAALVVRDAPTASVTAPSNS